MVTSLVRTGKSLQRWREVQAVLLRYGFDFLFEKEEVQEIRSFLHDRIHLTVGKHPSLDENIPKSIPKRACLMMQELGPTYVKLGQILSSRSDMLSDEWIAELSHLQDSVPPFPYEQVAQIIEKELGKPPNEVYLEFDCNPLAAASIGQVHRARLLSGEPVVVKIQRPGIKPQVHGDIDILLEIARLVESRTQWGKRLGMVSIIQEFGRTLDEEMDYRFEANNAERLRRNMMDQGQVDVPRMMWDLTTARVLTMEAVEGIKIDRLEQLDAAGVDRAELSDVFIRAVFKQLMIDGFFHADPHPGNLMVNTETRTLFFIDLGMMGSLLPEQRHQLGNLVQAIIRRDSSEVTRVVLQIGTIFGEVDSADLTRSIDRIINRYLDVSLERISIAELFAEILQAIGKHGIRLPSEYGLAIKTLIQGEGVARALDPNIAIVDILQTISQQMFWQQLDPRTLLDNLGTTLREANRLARALPTAVEGVLKSAEQGTLRVGLDIPDFRRTVHQLTVITNRMTAGLIVAGMIIGSAIAMGTSPKETWAFIPILGIIGFIISMLVGGTLVWLVFWDLWRNRKR